MGGVEIRIVLLAIIITFIYTAQIQLLCAVLQFSMRLNGLYGKAPPERGTLFRPVAYERVLGISLVEVYERVAKSVISA